MLNNEGWRKIRLIGVIDASLSACFQVRIEYSRNCESIRKYISRDLSYWFYNGNHGKISRDLPFEGSFSKITFKILQIFL